MLDVVSVVLLARLITPKLMLLTENTQVGLSVAVDLVVPCVVAANVGKVKIDRTKAISLKFFIINPSENIIDNNKHK